MRNAMLWVTLTVVLVVSLMGTLFWMQNSERLVQVSLDLGFAAWQLSEPVSVPALITISFGSGLGLGIIGILAQTARLGRRAQALPPLAGGTNERDWRA